MGSEAEIRTEKQQHSVQKQVMIEP